MGSTLASIAVTITTFLTTTFFYPVTQVPKVVEKFLGHNQVITKQAENQKPEVSQTNTRENSITNTEAQGLTKSGKSETQTSKNPEGARLKNQVLTKELTNTKNPEIKNIGGKKESEESQNLPEYTIPKEDKVSPEPVDASDSLKNIHIISPKSNQSFSSNDKVTIEAKTEGIASKVTFIVGSGKVAKEFTQPPYIWEYDLEKDFMGIDENFRQPLVVRAYREDGSFVEDVGDINIVPSELNNTNNNNTPGEQRDISTDTINFALADTATQKGATASGTYTIESYDPFINMTGVRTQIKVYNLKPNTRYELYAVIPSRSQAIGALTTEDAGYGEFNTGLAIDTHYCDIKSLLIQEEKSKLVELQATKLSSKCPQE